MINNFGGEKNYTVERFAPRLSALWRLYRKPQLPSRGKAHLGAIGDLSSDVRADPAAAGVFRRIILDGTRT
jgi:hypothetical protein